MAIDIWLLERVRASLPDRDLPNTNERGSASEKKVCRRSLPRMQLWANRTPFSTFALSRGLRGGAGRTPTP